MVHLSFAIALTVTTTYDTRQTPPKKTAFAGFVRATALFTTTLVTTVTLVSASFITAAVVIVAVTTAVAFVAVLFVIIALVVVVFSTRRIHSSTRFLSG